MENSPARSEKFIRVLLFSKHQIVKECLKLLLESNRGIKVVGLREITSGVSHENGFPKSDVAVVYFSNGDRIEIVEDLLQEFPDIRVIVITEGSDLESQAKALEMGAVGIVQKAQSPKLLLEAIRQTYNGETWLNQVLLNKILERGKSQHKNLENHDPQANSGEALTARELEVISMIGEGLKNKSIADRLFISEATVRHHLSSIYSKLGVTDRLNLVIYAYQRGLIKVLRNSADSSK
jgi:DNA-binding NarL/FixJ family response regulator